MVRERCMTKVYSIASKKSETHISRKKMKREPQTGQTGRVKDWQ